MTRNIICSRVPTTLKIQGGKLKQFSKLDSSAKPRWPLDEKAIFLKGAGVKL